MYKEFPVAAHDHDPGVTTTELGHAGFTKKFRPNGDLNQRFAETAPGL